MKLLMRYQMRFLRFNFIFSAAAFIVVAFLFRGDLLTLPDRLAMYGVILSIMYNYYSFLTSYEFRRILFTLPISAKDIIKTVFLTSIIMTTYIFLVAAITGLVSMQFTNLTLDPLIGVFIALPITWVAMSVKHYALLRSDIEGGFGMEMLVYLGVGILFAVPALALIFALPDAYFGYYVALLYVLSSAITYFMYKLCCKHTDQIYVVVRNERSKDVHESIHEVQLKI